MRKNKTQKINFPVITSHYPTQLIFTKITLNCYNKILIFIFKILMILINSLKTINYPINLNHIINVNNLTKLIIKINLSIHLFSNLNVLSHSHFHH